MSEKEKKISFLQYIGFSWNLIRSINTQQQE